MYRTSFSDDTDIAIDSGSEWHLGLSDRRMSSEESLSEDLPPMKRICKKRAKRKIIQSPVFRTTKLNSRKYKMDKFSKTKPSRKNERYDTSDEESEDGKEVESDTKNSSLHNRQCGSNNEEHEDCSENHNVRMSFDEHNIKKLMNPETDFDEDHLEHTCEKEESDESTSETHKKEEDTNIILNDRIDDSPHSVDAINITAEMKSTLNDVHHMVNNDNHSGSDNNSDISAEDTLLFEKKKVKCSIVIPDCDWKNIKPSKPAYKLKTGWTDIFARQLRTEMPSCSLTFKYQKVKKKNSRKKNCPYFKAQAKCKGVQCGTFDFVISEKPPKRCKEVAIQVIGHNIRHSNKEIKHKRHLMRSERTETQQTLQSKGVSNVFYEKAGSMQDSELQFGNLSYCQSPTVLRKAKSEWNVHQNLHQDPFTELVLTKNILEDEDVCSKICKGYVQHIGFIPFLTLLFTEKQLMVLKHEVKHNSSVVYFDATGTVVERIQNKRVLYYAMVLPGPKGSPPLPVFEFLSDSQNTPTITYALMIFIHWWKKIAGKLILSRVTVDFSWALIHSVLMSINNINIHVYLQWCFDIVYHGKMGQKYTVVHICCNHLLKAFRDRISSIKIDKTTKEYITRTFALVINCTDLPTAINLWKILQLVFCASSPINVVENSLPELEACFIAGNTSQIKDEQEFMCGVAWEEDSNVNGIRRSSPFRHLFTLGSDTVRNSENPYACDEVLRILCDDFMPLLPLWSGIMLGQIERHSVKRVMHNSVQSLTRESNAHVENWMKIVKCDTLQKDVRLRAGKFVRKLHVNLKGRIVAFQNNLHQFKPQNVVQNNEDFNNAEESWNKKGTPLTKRKSRYFTPIAEPKGTKPETPKQTKTKSKPQKMNDMTIKDQSKLLPKHGISNRQQTCWIISTLQAIAASTIELKPEQGNDVMECIVDIVKTLREPVSDIQIHDLNSLRSKMKKDKDLLKQFQLGVQHDSAELHEMLYNRGNFNVSLAAIFRCIRCSKERTVEEVLSILPVEIPGLDKPFISNCIDEFMKEEVLIDEDRSGQFCVGCSENTPHGRRYEFSKDSLPDNICVQVKRFVQNDNGPRKITKDIIVNRVIGIGDGKTLYRLAAIQCHSGKDLLQGHYWTVTYSSSGDVILKNDRHVELKEPKYLDCPYVQESVYIVLYTKLDIVSPFSSNSVLQANVVEFIKTLSDGFENDIMCRKNRYCLRKVDFKTIVERKWLNDEIINYYLNLLENDRTKSLDVFFYSTLKKSKAIAVDRLIKAEVMNFDMIFVPINVSNHWILCTIDTTSKTIQWYDSYLSLTSLTTKHKKMDLIRDAVNEAVSPGEIQWKTSVIQHTPQQSNCSDCGVYLCHFAALLSLRQPVTFDSANMLNYRYGMMLECLSGHLFNRVPACVHLGSTHRVSIINDTTSIIHGEVGKPMHLQCPFSVIKTVLKRNGIFVKEDRFGALAYSLIPRKEDHNSTFSCETYTSAGNKRTKNAATLDIRHKPYLFMNYTSNSAFEGQSVTLCCSSESRQPTLDIWLEMESKVLSSKYDSDVLCHEIIDISRADSGSYKCFAENEVGTVNDEVIITVLYPPNIPDQHINFTETDESRTLHCLAYGVPVTYSYGRWQHLSYFGEHIRYLNPSSDGKVTLPPMTNKMERYQDNGIYLCTASNSVVDSFGNSLQTGKIFVMTNGPPIFVKKIEHKPYGHPGKLYNLSFIVYGTSEIECYNVKSENKEIAASMQVTSINSTMVFHGTEISVKTMEIVLSFNISDKSSRQDYTVTLCNGYGNSSFVVYITSVPVDEEVKKIKNTTVAIIVFSIMVVICVPILGAAVFLRRKRNRRVSEDILESESVEGQSVPIENIMYQTATQSVAFPPSPVQTSTEIIEYNRGSYVQEQTTAPLTGQLNYADVIFPPSTRHDVVHIIGIENRTVYADVTVSAGATSLVDSRSTKSSDEGDFIEIEGLENFADKRKQH